MKHYFVFAIFVLFVWVFFFGPVLYRDVFYSAREWKELIEYEMRRPCKDVWAEFEKNKSNQILGWENCK